jgi:two-component system LytT family response regulator
MTIGTAAISWIEADDDYACLHCNGTCYLLRQSLTQLERELDPTTFIRVHRSAIVNVAYIRELQRGPDGHISVILQDGTRVPVSERRRALVTRVFGRS